MYVDNLDLQLYGKYTTREKFVSKFIEKLEQELNVKKYFIVAYKEHFVTTDDDKLNLLLAELDKLIQEKNKIQLALMIFDIAKKRKRKNRAYYWMNEIFKNIEDEKGTNPNENYRLH